MKTTTIHAAETDLSRLIEAARAGDEVVIARGKAAVVRLVPADAPGQKSRFGSTRGRAKATSAFFEPLPDELRKAWGGDERARASRHARVPVVAGR